MKISTIQWNIRGGKIRDVNSAINSDESYNRDGVEYMKDVLKKYNPDIVFLQETHEKDNYNLVQELSTYASKTYFFNDIYAESHIVEGFGLGQGIISKFKINNHSFEFFFNPKLEIICSNGEKWITHNKGLSKCFIDINGTIIELMTLHLMPFRRFRIDPFDKKLDRTRKDIRNKIFSKNKNFILEGDFNINNSSLKKFLPNFFINDTKEVILDKYTTPFERYYDHVIYGSIKHISSTVLDNVLTDHYPIYSKFEIR
ncbi:endonuclease/exonuclease/phosphatase family protein [Candidatus Parcubacteria bacterium]|nr:endonuclease/exonuclease/phosphatase family protein [Candidatus Parcubacteria bacterium]